MSALTEALAWVHRAEEDWLLARSALRRKVPLIYGVQRAPSGIRVC
jgi:hypothetical protein